MNFIEKLKDKKCLVIGAGITGMAVQKALSNFGAKVVVFDEKKSRLVNNQLLLYFRLSNSNLCQEKNCNSSWKDLV